MKRLIIAVLALLVLAGAADAKILVVVGNTTASLVNADGKYVMNVWGRWQKILGVEYDTYAANYQKIVGTDTTNILDVANSGDYSMAILLNLPVLSSTSFDDSAGTDIVAAGWGIGDCHLAKWVNRRSAYKFPIPLFVPMVTYMANANAWITAKTGNLTPVTRSWTSTHDRSLTDAQGDSIYTSVQPTNITEAMVAGQDSLSFVRLLLWRDDEATWDALDAKPTYAWMTVGTGSHKVIYMPYAFQHFNAFMWPTIIGMFEKITPVDMPIVAEHFGSASADFWGASKDTTSLGANFKAIKDYAVANGMKIDLLGLTYSMKNETAADAHAVFQTTATTYANAHPNNIRITPSTYEGWGTSLRDWTGSVNATTYLGVDGMVARITTAQTGIAANFPTMSLTRASTYAGYIGATAPKPDSVLAALTSKSIADIYTVGNGASAVGYPGSTNWMIIGAQRTWVGRGASATEIRLHPYSGYWRYQLNNDSSTGADDTLRIGYINTAAYNDNRADCIRYLVPVSCGYYRTTAAANAIGSSGLNIQNTATTFLATHGAGYQPGLRLNAFTFTGGSILNPNHATKKFTMAGADSSRSLFLDVMKQVNNQVKMANYISSTYGSTGQPIFVYSWMEDVNHDRRLGRTYSNNHVRHE